MYQRCSKSVHLQCPGSVPAVYCFWKNLGKFWGHCKHISNVPSVAVFLACAYSVPRISQNFPKSGTLQEHSQDTANVLIQDICKVTANEPLGNITGAFFGKPWGLPSVYLMGTLWSHDLEHCKCTGSFP